MSTAPSKTLLTSRSGDVTIDVVPNGGHWKVGHLKRPWREASDYLAEVMHECDLRGRYNLHPVDRRNGRCIVDPGLRVGVAGSENVVKVTVRPAKLDADKTFEHRLVPVDAPFSAAVVRKTLSDWVNRTRKGPPSKEELLSALGLTPDVMSGIVQEMEAMGPERVAAAFKVYTGVDPPPIQGLSPPGPAAPPAFSPDAFLAMLAPFGAVNGGGNRVTVT